MKFSVYTDKVRACWLGKNIGGTLGVPHEGHRGVFDLTYYTHDLSAGALPNDDLDLQLVWLMAAEAHGRQVNAEVLWESPFMTTLAPFSARKLRKRRWG